MAGRQDGRQREGGPRAGGPAAAKDDLGRRGEDAAVEYLTARGFVVLARNWRRRDGELDIVVTDRTRLVVCEVKTRSGTGFGRPEEAVTPLKAARIRRLAGQWLAETRSGWCEVRFDVVAVVLAPGREPRLEHLEGAF